MTSYDDGNRERCRNCRHWLPCDFLDPGLFDEEFGRGCEDEMRAGWGMCELDNPALVPGDYVETQWDCWEDR